MPIYDEKLIIFYTTLNYIKMNYSLIEASGEGKIKIVRRLLKERADINLQDIDGNTALIWASKGGYTEIVRILLDGRADPNIKNKSGHTALMIASWHDHIEIVNLLLKAGTDYNLENNHNFSPLFDFTKYIHILNLLLPINIQIWFSYNYKKDLLYCRRMVNISQVINYYTTIM